MNLWQYPRVPHKLCAIKGLIIWLIPNFCTLWNLWRWGLGVPNKYLVVHLGKQSILPFLKIYGQWILVFWLVMRLCSLNAVHRQPFSRNWSYIEWDIDLMGELGYCSIPGYRHKVHKNYICHWPWTMCWASIPPPPQHTHTKSLVYILERWCQFMGQYALHTYALPWQ